MISARHEPQPTSMCSDSDSTGGGRRRGRGGWTLTRDYEPPKKKNTSTSSLNHHASTSQYDYYSKSLNLRSSKILSVYPRPDGRVSGVPVPLRSVHRGFGPVLSQGRRSRARRRESKPESWCDNYTRVTLLHPNVERVSRPRPSRLLSEKVSDSPTG